jgi:hypothetical protein
MEFGHKKEVITSKLILPKKVILEMQKLFVSTSGRLCHDSGPEACH